MAKKSDKPEYLKESPHPNRVKIMSYIYRYHHDFLDSISSQSNVRKSELMRRAIDAVRMLYALESICDDLVEKSMQVAKIYVDDKYTDEKDRKMDRQWILLESRMDDFLAEMQRYKGTSDSKSMQLREVLDLYIYAFDHRLT